MLFPLPELAVLISFIFSGHRQMEQLVFYRALGQVEPGCPSEQRASAMLRSHTSHVPIAPLYPAWLVVLPACRGSERLK
jgi:hypothetical protein